MLGAVHAFDQIGNVIEREAGSQASHVTGGNSEGLTGCGCRGTRETPPQRVIHDLSECPASAAASDVSFAATSSIRVSVVRIIMMLPIRHRDVKFGCQVSSGSCRFLQRRSSLEIAGFART